jgi:pyruvate dehydrogenase E2 component (dihydrolipoamide acetyltransferase)
MLVAAALRDHPLLNARWQDGNIHINDEINIGLAVAVQHGLIVPVIHKADQKTLKEIATRRAELVSRAKDGRLAPQDLAGGTFTVSNLGMYGVDVVKAIINPPQAAILAVGRIAQRVVPVGGEPKVRPMMTLCLSCDHRTVDGARAGMFLGTLRGLIEEPMNLLTGR